MPGRKITVTPNVEYCLDFLKKAVRKLPEGEEKKEAAKVMNYLLETAGGKTQHYRGAHCNYAEVIPPFLLPEDHKYYKP